MRYSFLILISFLTFSYPSFGKTLELQSLEFIDFNKKGSDSWISKTDPQFVIVVRELSNAWFALDEKGVSDYLKKQQETRSMINDFAGISEWKIENSDFKKTGHTARLTMNGQFTANQQTVYFTEVQVFEKPHINQIKFSAKDKSQLKSEKINPLLEKFYKAVK